MTLEGEKLVYRDTPSVLAKMVLRLGFPVLGRLAPSLATRLGAWLITKPRRTEPTPEESRWLSLARYYRIPYKDCDLAVMEWGQGPIILLVHGWCSMGLRFSKMIDPLVKSGYRVVAFDAPAHGQSSGSHINIMEWSGAILTVAAKVGHIHGLVAHSIGATAAVLSLDRGLRVKRLVFFSALLNSSDSFIHFSRILNIPDNVTQSMIRFFDRVFQRSVESIDILLIAGQIETPPLLVFHDQNDSVLPHDEALKLAAVWKGSRLVSTSGKGHHSIIENPDAINEAISFIGPRSVRTPHGCHARVPSGEPFT